MAKGLLTAASILACSEKFLNLMRVISLLLQGLVATQPRLAELLLHYAFANVGCSAAGCPLCLCYHVTVPLPAGKSLCAHPPLHLWGLCLINHAAAAAPPSFERACSHPSHAHLLSVPLLHG
jgi:hypothetical protein